MAISLSDVVERELSQLVHRDPDRCEAILRALRHVGRSGFAAGGFAYVRHYEDGLSRYYSPVLDANLYVTEAGNDDAEITYIGLGT